VYFTDSFKILLKVETTALRVGLVEDLSYDITGK
jgi:hypothetical protein